MLLHRIVFENNNVCLLKKINVLKQVRVESWKNTTVQIPMYCLKEHQPGVTWADIVGKGVDKDSRVSEVK